MWTVGKSFCPLVSADIRDVGAPLSYSSANREGKRTSYHEESGSAGGSSGVRIFRSGGFQQNFQSGCWRFAGKVAEGSCAPAKVWGTRTHFVIGVLIHEDRWSGEKSRAFPCRRGFLSL